MGKGDKKSKKGKISIGSYGNSRKRKSRSKQKQFSAPAVKESSGEVAEAKPKKTARKKADA